MSTHKQRNVPVSPFIMTSFEIPAVLGNKGVELLLLFKILRTSIIQHQEHIPSLTLSNLQTHFDAKVADDF